MKEEYQRLAIRIPRRSSAGEAGQRHFADGLLEGVLGTQLRHIVIAPADGSNTQGNSFRIKHKTSSL